jgi:DNA-directed RNA polymerase subunit RPC12/RpoP
MYKCERCGEGLEPDEAYFHNDLEYCGHCYYIVVGGREEVEL